MRFLHTSDWHLGKSLKGRSRSDEHQAALAEILDIVRREEIDAVLITGDVFDTQAPPPEAEQLAFNFFSELRGLNIPAVVIAGNHDHPKRLLAIRDVLHLLDIHIRPEPVRPPDGGIVKLETKGEVAHIAVLPFVTVGKIADAAMLMGPEVERFQAYSERIAAMCDVLSQSFSAKTVNLMMAHLYVDGAATCRSERDVHVTKPYAVQAQRFPSNAHYIALGHLHRPQEIPAPSRTFYAGSILQLDFGEQDQRKRVVVIDAKPRKPATIDSIELIAGRNLRDVTGTLAELTAQIAVLPFVTVGKISDAAMLMGPEVERFQAYSERIAAMCGVLGESFAANTVNLMMAHLYVDGAVTCKSERDVHVTKPYAVQAQRFPANAHYIALGHLHRPQEIPAPSRTFYAGSILQLDFGEQDQRKRVVVIDAHPRKPAKIESIEITAGRNLRDVSGTLAQLTAQAAEFANDLLRVTVLSDSPIPGVADHIRDLLPNALEVRPGWSSPAQAAAPEISGTDPFDLFCRYYSKQTGSQPADQVAKLFKELYEEAVNASD